MMKTTYHLNSFTPILSRLVTALSLSMMIGGGLTACGKNENTETFLSEAKKYQQQGDNKAAIIQLKNTLQKTPDNVEARFLLGSIYKETGENLSAEKELRKALSLGMDTGKVFPLLGKTLLAMGKFQEILDEAKKIPESQHTAEILTLRGSANLALAHPQEARELFERALRSKPDFPDALIGLAIQALIEKDAASAEKYTRQAVIQNPNNIEALLFKADLLRAQNKLDEALAVYDEVIKLKPDHSMAYINKANIEIGRDKFDAASTNIAAARKIAPDNLTVFYTQAVLDFKQNKHAAALESLQQILKAAPDHLPSVLLAGAVQFALGSLPQAEQYLKQYLEKDPDNLYARKMMASVLLRSHQTQRAISMLVPMLQNTPQDPYTLALAGEAYMQSSDFVKATEYFEKANALDPKSPSLLTSLSMSNLAKGNSAGAIANLEAAVSLDPKSTRASVLLVMTHLRLKEYDKAMTVLKTLENAEPKNPFYQNLAGGIFIGKKDVASARKSFEKGLLLQPDYFPAIANLAQLDLQEKKPEVARKRFEALVEKNPKHIQAMTALADMALSENKPAEATTWLEQAYNKNPDTLEPAVTLVNHYIRLKENQKALTLAQKLRSTHPEKTDVLELLARTQLASDDKNAALDSYNKLSGMLPDSSVAPVQFRIATLHMAMKNEAAASDALKKSLSAKPDYLDAALAQAMLEARKGNHEQAITMATQIQSQHEKSPSGYMLEGDIRMGQKKPELAIKPYEHALKLAKSGTVLIKIHASLDAAGKKEEANTRLLQWLKESPSDMQTRLYLAGTYLANKQNQVAIEQYLIILKQDPKYVPALNNLATLYQQEKHPDALIYAERAYQLAPENPAVLDTLGWILVEQGKTAKAVPLLQKAVSLAPAAAEIRYHLATGLMKSGDRTGARKELEQILTAGKGFEEEISKAQALIKQME